MKHFELLNTNSDKGVKPLPKISPIGGGSGGQGTPFCGLSQIGDPDKPKPTRPRPRP